MVTCAEAVKEAITNLEGIVSTKDVINYIYKKYPERPWKETSIRHHLAGLSVNHPSSIYHPTLRKQAFLFYLGEGKFRPYDPENDGKWVADSRGVHLADDESNDIETEKDLIEASISFEKDLEEYIVRNLSQIEDGLTLYRDKELTGRQLTTEIGRLDILAIDKNNNFVVIELKSGIANYHVIGQILSYISWVRKNLANNKKVRGIIIADEFDDKLKYAISELYEIKLKKYCVKFEFQDTG